MNTSLSDKLPFWHFEEGLGGGHLMVYGDGTLGAGFKLKGLDISCATNSFKNDFSAKFENVLNGIQENTRLQIFYKLSPKVHGKIAEHEAISRAIQSRAMRPFPQASRAMRGTTIRATKR